MRLLHEVLVVCTAPSVESSENNEEKRPANDEAQRDRAHMPYVMPCHFRTYHNPTLKGTKFLFSTSTNTPAEKRKSDFIEALIAMTDVYKHIFNLSTICMCCRMRDFVNEYVEQLLDAKADDEASRQSSFAADLALADYRMVDHVLRRSPLLPADIELRLSHTVSLWNLAFLFLPK